MKGIQIVSTGRALPEKVITNDDLSEIVDTSDEWIRTRTGIRQRHKCTDESCTSLAVSAARKALGNGWTVDVIAHIFSFLPDEYKKE